MLYKDLLQVITVCPFCEPVANRKIETEDNAFLTYSLAPYHKYHLLVIPKRHIEDFKELIPEETKDIEKLLKKGVGMLEYLGHKEYTILVRNGASVGKSIAHLHYHIIPSVMIGDINNNVLNLKVMTEKEINELMEEFNKIDKIH